MSTTQWIKIDKTNFCFNFSCFVAYFRLQHPKLLSNPHIFWQYGKNSIMFTIESQGNIAESVALSFEQIVAVRTFDHDGYVVIAVLTAPIFSQTERQNLIASVKSMVAEDLNITQDQVIVTYDMELFRAMDEVKNEDKERLLEKAIKLSGTPF